MPCIRRSAAPGDGLQDRLALQDAERGVGGGHAGFVVVEGAALRHAVPDDAHDFFLAAEGRDRIAVAERLGVGRQVGLDVEDLLGAAVGDAEAGLDLIEDEDDPVLVALAADELQETRLRHRSRRSCPGTVR